MDQYDIAIIGMGPAGATLARLLGPHYRVAVLDLKDLSGEEGFQKPCGGLLAPDAQKVLARFQLTLPGEVLASPQIFSVKTIDLPAGLVRYYQRFYLNVDRHKFDLWLASLAGPGVTLLDRTRCTGLVRSSQGFSVSYRRDGKEGSLWAKWLVGADGAHSLVRRTLLPRPIRQYVAIQEWFPEEHSHPFYSSIFDPQLTDCYCWSDSKDGCFILGAALPKEHCRENFRLLKERLGAFGYTFGQALRQEACLVDRPSSPFQFSLCKGGAFLIGEAAGFVSPSSLEGISSAMLSARALANALNRHPDAPERYYRRGTLRLRLKLSAKLLKVPFLYFPPLRRLVMKSGLTAIDLDQLEESSPSQSSK